LQEVIMGGGVRSRRGLLLIPLLGIALLLGSTAGCGAKRASADEDDFAPRIPLSVWGGAGVEVTTTEEGATVQFDCASGVIEQPIEVNWLGNFDVSGSYLRERDALGNLVREIHPARFQGTIHGDFFSMTVFLSDGGQLVGAYAATRGMPASIHRCL
jgi:hypothetical protein